MNKPWKVAYGQPWEGGLWIGLGRLPVDRPGKVACGRRALLGDLWTIPGM